MNAPDDKLPAPPKDALRQMKSILDGVSTNESTGTGSSRASLSAQHLEPFDHELAADAAARAAASEISRRINKDSGKKAMTFRMDDNLHLKLKRLSVEERKSVHDLLMEGIRLVFLARSLPPPMIRWYAVTPEKALHQIAQDALEEWGNQEKQGTKSHKKKGTS